MASYVEVFLLEGETDGGDVWVSVVGRGSDTGQSLGFDVVDFLPVKVTAIALVGKIVCRSIY